MDRVGPMTLSRVHSVVMILIWKLLVLICEEIASQEVKYFRKNVFQKYIMTVMLVTEEKKMLTQNASLEELDLNLLLSLPTTGSRSSSTSTNEK